MKITELYISAFGKLSDFHLKLSSGLNSICERNGFGKTTIAAFIKAMLYGLDDTRKLSVLENDRKRYLPWGAAVGGGTLTFEYSGKVYRIERSFGKKPADDTLTVFDLSLGLPTDKFEDGVGESLFGIDADGFERTVFLSEKNLVGNEKNQSISAKLSNLVGVENDMGQYEDAVSRLDELKKKYYKRGGGGLISDTKAQISETEAALALLEKKRDMTTEMQIEADSLRQEIATLIERKKKLLAKNALSQRAKGLQGEAEAIEKRRGKLLESKARFAELTEWFGGKAPTAEEIYSAKDKLKEADATLEAHSEKGTEKTPSQNGAKKSAVLKITGIVIAVVAVILGISVHPATFAVALPGIILTAYAFYSERAKKSDEDERAQTLSQTLATARAQKEETTRFFLRFGLTAETSDALFDKIKEYERLEILISTEEEELLSRLERLEEAGVSPLTTTDADVNYEEELKSADEALISAEKRLTALSMEQNRLLSDLESADDTEQKYKELCEDYQRYCKNLNAITSAKALLEAAKNNIDAKYLDGARAAFDKYIKTFREATADFTMDTSFNIKKFESGASRERDAFSKGTRELYALALRLALVDALYEDEKPPIFLDDPFAYFDDDKIECAISVLKALSRERQILYMTCTSARVAD